MCYIKLIKTVNYDEKIEPKDFFHGDPNRTGHGVIWVTLKTLELDNGHPWYI